MNAIQCNAFRPRRRQAGISLLVVLILLLVTSVLGIAVLRSSAMQERMSGNMYDRSLAMQAAELGLNAGQQALNAAPKWQDTVPVDQDCIDSSICPTFKKQGEATWRAGPILGASDSNVPDTPSDYWIEYLGINQAHMETGGTIPSPDSVTTGPMYRITARSQGNGRAEVILQNDVIYRFPRL
ncbi:pilus assembly PilX family protein [Luteimonas mephitis]|uniref:pilus assembly PilX family protein n=1 Tax=Luteimonas mephitis TaxID=83615 RepID=UPI0009FF5FC2|nr:PilX N-terminal domain-containing pilus assembly protein [Luteimonas mephitis]HWL29287.1 PilX N-terminal domain-containing pilus assembly protein [Burkholderiaceae bacterium]